MFVKQMNIREKMSALEIIEEMEKAGVFIAGRLAKAVNVLAEMIGDDEVTVFFRSGRGFGSCWTWKDNSRNDL
ncbi:MAG: hypothetical protein QXX87_05310 [Candidatus Jordarchaeales archaeon]